MAYKSFEDFCKQHKSLLKGTPAEKLVRAKKFDEVQKLIESATSQLAEKEELILTALEINYEILANAEYHTPKLNKDRADIENASMDAVEKDRLLGDANNKIDANQRYQKATEHVIELLTNEFTRLQVESNKGLMLAAVYWQAGEDLGIISDEEIKSSIDSMTKRIQTASRMMVWASNGEEYIVPDEDKEVLQHIHTEYANGTTDEDGRFAPQWTGEMPSDEALRQSVLDMMKTHGISPTEEELNAVVEQMKRDAELFS